MEDGQEAGVYAPDRTEEDPTDLEYDGEIPSAESGEDDDDDDESSGESSDPMDADDDNAERAPPPKTSTRPPAQGGTPDPSLEQFLAEWSDDDSVSKDDASDAAPRAKPPKVPTTRPSAAGSSSGAARPTAVKGKQVHGMTTRRPTVQAPLNVAPLRCRMPTGAPRTVGYAFIFLRSTSLSLLVLTSLFLLSANRLGLMTSTPAFQSALVPLSRPLPLLQPFASGRQPLIDLPKMLSALPRRPASLQLKRHLLPTSLPGPPSARPTRCLLVSEERNRSIRLPRLRHAIPTRPPPLRLP